MKTSRIIFLVFILLIIIWGAKVIDEYEIHSEKQTNQEYLDYITTYQAAIQDQIADFESEFGSSLALNYDPSVTTDLSTCKTSNFEGADVKIEGVQFFNKRYGQVSTNGYQFDCNLATLDPDHPYFGLPDIQVAVSPVEYFKPKDPGLHNFFKWMGSREEQGPFKTYEKQLVITDSTGNTTIRKFAMELWLTKFNVSVTVRSDRDKPNIDFTEKELVAKRYPRYWYGSTDPGLISVNDLDRKEENKDFQYGNIQFILKVDPNASPWYIKSDEAQSTRPKIAVAGVYCQHFEKNSMEASKVDFNMFAGKASPLYYSPFEQDSLVLVSGMALRSSSFFEKINEINEQDIWDRPYYIRLISKNIGSRKKLFEQKDDQVNMEFLMPLFVVGSLDVILPSELLAEWNPPDPYSRKFQLKNLLPNWGMGGFGKLISIAILIIALVLGMNFLFPFLRFLS